eukprot:Sdes_comp20647_c0_seq4m15900
MIGSLAVLFADLNEYVAFYGSALPVKGYSLKWDLHIYDFLFQGIHQSYAPGETLPHTHVADALSSSKSVLYLAPRDHKYINLGGDFRYEIGGEADAVFVRNCGAWMLEYGYGSVFSTFWQALFHPTLFYSLDFYSVFIAASDSFHLIVKNFLSRHF